MVVRIKQKPSDESILSLRSDTQWLNWLKTNHFLSTGVWLHLHKKGSAEKFPTYSEALDVALCYGWIDGQKKSHDQNSFLQRFTPRRARSTWSKVNTEHAERLIKTGKMKAAGLLEVETAKKDGRWKVAYDSPSKAAVPEDFLKLLSQNKKAEAFFKTLNKTNLYSIVYRLQTAKKPETREKRIKTIIEMLSKGEKFH